MCPNHIYYITGREKKDFFIAVVTKPTTTAHHHFPNYLTTFYNTDLTDTIIQIRIFLQNRHDNMSLNLSDLELATAITFYCV